MAYSNNMSKLLDKIERRLGTRPMNLPEQLQKDKWAEVIIEDTLTTFSRYFPHKIRFTINSTTCKKKNGYYLIDEDMFPGIEIIGVKDIAWETLGGTMNSLAGPYGMYDYNLPGMNLGDVLNVQMAADQVSLLNTGIYVEYEQPNKLVLKNAENLNVSNSINSFDVDLFIKHSDNLNTIAPTKMEVFEDLAKVDVATFLFQELKYFDGLDTVYGNIDLKMAELENQASRRPEIIDLLNNSYVSTANDNQPMLMSI